MAENYRHVLSQWETNCCGWTCFLAEKDVKSIKRQWSGLPWTPSRTSVTKKCAITTRAILTRRLHLLGTRTFQFYVLVMLKIDFLLQICHRATVSLRYLSFEVFLEWSCPNKIPFLPSLNSQTLMFYDGAHNSVSLSHKNLQVFNCHSNWLDHLFGDVWILNDTLFTTCREEDDIRNTLRLCLCFCQNCISWKFFFCQRKQTMLLWLECRKRCPQNNSIFLFIKHRSPGILLRGKVELKRLTWDFWSRLHFRFCRFSGLSDCVGISKPVALHTWHKLTQLRPTQQQFRDDEELFLSCLDITDQEISWNIKCFRGWKCWVLSLELSWSAHQRESWDLCRSKSAFAGFL